MRVTVCVTACVIMEGSISVAVFVGLPRCVDGAFVKRGIVAPGIKRSQNWPRRYVYTGYRDPEDGGLWRIPTFRNKWGKGILVMKRSQMMAALLGVYQRRYAGARQR